MRKLIGLIRPIGLIRLIGPLGPMGLIGLIGFIGLSLTSCHREPLELYKTESAHIRVNIDWMTHFKEKPSGMTIILAKDSDQVTFTDITNNVNYYDLYLEPGNYKMLIFNHSYGEFGSMNFGQTGSFNDIYAVAKQNQDRIRDSWDVNVDYRREPEHIGCVVDTIPVTPDMVGGETHFFPYYEKEEQEETIDRIDSTYKEVVEPMTTEMYIRVRVLGIKYMSSVIGNISGMADGFLLTQAWRRSGTCYHLLDNWSRSATTYINGDTLKSVGYISTTIRTFGLPHGRELNEQRDSVSNMLSLCFTLIDGTQHVFRYPVGKMIRYRSAELQSRADNPDDESGSKEFPKSAVTLELDLLVDAPFYEDDEVPNLPYAQPSGTGAFDAEVAPWGDDVDVDIPM